jgi:hypothetical protein
MKLLIYISLLGFLTLINSSCTFYYKTSDIDTNLKNAVSQINSNYSTAQNKINTTQNEFKAMKCNSETLAIKKAKDYLESMENSMAELNEIKANVNSEYAVFLKYSKGKTQIQSNSDEWKKLKQTKKALKGASKDFKRKGNSLKKIASDFSEFTSKELGSIQYVDVAIYNKKFDDLQGEFTNQEKDLALKVKNNETEVTQIISKKTDTQAEKCKLLQEELSKVLEEKKKVSNLKTKISQSITSFKTSTTGTSRIYSCSTEWEIVKKTEENMNEYQLELQRVIQSLSQIHAHMQEIITSMN